jgi:hypothetical protein
MGVLDATEADPDRDGVVSAHDNCPDVANPKQEDGDRDGYGDTCDPGSARPPVIRIIMPRSGARVEVGTVVEIMAEAKDSDGQIIGVEFWEVKDGGESLIEDVRMPPFTAKWRPVEVGTYRVTVTAHDNDAASASATLRLIVVGREPHPSQPQ